jgi:hypothetical protein
VPTDLKNVNTWHGPIKMEASSLGIVVFIATFVLSSAKRTVSINVRSALYSHSYLCAQVAREFSTLRSWRKLKLDYI